MNTQWFAPVFFGGPMMSRDLKPTVSPQIRATSLFAYVVNLTGGSNREFCPFNESNDGVLRISLK